MKGSTALVIIGVDPHKRTHTASVVETGTDKVLATLQIDASFAGYRRLLKWASGFEQRRWAVENARGLGRHLAQWLVAREEVVDDVPSTATARVRELSWGGRRKNDVIDAAAASVAALRGGGVGKDRVTSRNPDHERLVEGVASARGSGVASR
jgi:hypothetical protein